MRRLLLVLLVACSRKGEPREPWQPAPEPAWGPLPKTDDEARALAGREEVKNEALRFDASMLEDIQADATKLVAGEDEIAAAYDGWVAGAGKKPCYLLFGTAHDSRAELEAAMSIVLRMRTLWGVALEQFRAAGRWGGAPPTPSADDADLALVDRSGAPDDAAIYRINQRQEIFDHAAWKFGYLASFKTLLYAARGVGLPVLGCDMPPELRTHLSPGGEAESALRELHCARALRSAIIPLAPAHAGDAGLEGDDDPPPERYAVIVGRNHAQPDGMPRFFKKGTRFASVMLYGGRPRESGGEEVEDASRLVVLDPVVVRSHGPDALLLPDDVWGGTVDRVTEHDVSAQPKVAGWLPPLNVVATTDEPARFAVGEASIDITDKPQWVASRASHQAFVLVSSSVTMLGAVDVPPSGYAELHFSPKSRAVRITVHTP